MSFNKAAAEIQRLVDLGLNVELIRVDSQPYAFVRTILAPSPPWDRDRYDILISIPLAFDFGTPLDGFYLGLPYNFHGGDHNRVNGKIITAVDRQWRLVSWHYPDDKGFNSTIDTIESHIVHCRGFFLERGAVNART